MLPDPNQNGPGHKGKEGGPPQAPGPEGKGPSVDILRSDLEALVEALRHQNTQIPFAVSLCARNFASTATSALGLGRLTPDQVLECLQLRNPATRELVFKEEKFLEPLLIAVSNAVREQISAAHKAAHTPGFNVSIPAYAISHKALDALATFVADEQGIGLKARLAAYEAIVVGSTRTIQVTESGNLARESSAIIALISRSLQLKSEAFSYEVAGLVQGIGEIPTHSLFAQPVDNLLVNLSRPGASGVPANVQVAALKAIGERCDLSENFDKNNRRVGTTFTRESYAMYLVNALGQSTDPDVLKSAARFLEVLLQTEVTCMRSSFEVLGGSDFVQSVPHRSWTRAVARVREHAKTHLTDSGEVTQETLRSLSEALSAAEKLDRGILIHTATKLLTGNLPERIAKPIEGLAHNWFKRVSIWKA